MFLAAYDEEKDRAKALKEQEKLIQEAELNTENSIREALATDMLLDGKPLMEILKYSKLSEDKIRQLAESLGVSVVV